MLPTNVRCFLLAAALSVASVNGGPKYNDGGFVPSSIGYLEKAGKAQDQIAMPSGVDPRTEASPKHADTDTNDISDRSQEPRFGFTGIGNSGTGYGGVSQYGPAKIDIGGLVLGAIIGVGSILIIPKLLYILSGTYGAYARSEDNGFAHSLTKLDDALARHGIDTTSCMQRAMCTYSQHAAAAVKSAGEETENEENQASSFDKMIDAITTNQVFRTAMQGTAIQEAVEAGRAGRDCSRSYPHCGFSMETMLSLTSNLIAAANAANAANARVTTPTSA